MSEKRAQINDIQWMQQAINLAKRGRFTTTPNPNVGCVIVKDGQLIGQGYHQKAGQGHAEVNALASAVGSVKGATAYVTLEPCSHTGRTPPCAQGLIDAGIARVVIAMTDPNPKVAGRGIAMLKKAGIAITSDILQTQARALNPGFLQRMEHQRPFVTVKLGMTLDGCTALQDGSSKWITSSESRIDVQQFRAQSCAILTGSATVLADDPSLNLRWNELGLVREVIEQSALRQPIRIVIDSNNKIQPQHKMIGINSPIILVRRQADDNQWPVNVEQLIMPGQGQIDLGQLMTLLAKREINSIWVEAGATLCGALLSANLVDKLVVYQAAKLMGSGNKGLFNLPSIDHMDKLIDLRIDDVRMIAKDIRICAIPIKKE